MIVSTGLASAVLVGGFLLLVLIRVPVAFALGIATVPIVLLDIRLTPFIVLDRMFQSYNSFVLLAVPFFLLAAVSQLVALAGLALVIGNPSLLAG